MNRLVCNKTSPTYNRHLYKRNGHLVRTPIYKTYTLTPSAQALYDVGDAYKQVLPTRDFFTTSGSGNYAIMAGHSMRRCYLGRETPSHDSSGWMQIWRNNNSYSATSDTGYVFYNGNYSPAMGLMGGAAFLRVPAYKFSIPSEISNSTYSWTVSSIKFTFVTHGIVLTSGGAAVRKTNSGQYPVFAMDANTTLLPSGSDWRSSNRPMNVGVFGESTLATNQTPPMTLYGQCQQTVNIPNVRTDACDNTGASNGFPLWISWPGGQVTYVDGHIINAPSNPYSFQVDATSTLCDAATALISSGAFFIPMIPAVGDSGSGGSTVTNNDYPYYYFSSSSGGASNWWLCERHLLRSIEITFALV